MNKPINKTMEIPIEDFFKSQEEKNKSNKDKKKDKPKSKKKEKNTNPSNEMFLL